VLQAEFVESTFPADVDEEEDDELPSLLSSGGSTGSESDFPSPEAVDFRELVEGLGDLLLELSIS
jgi:hypothetical protein